VAATLALLATPAVASAERPDASFTVSPADPRVGQTVRFVSSSCDPDGRVARQAWDLDGDGAYDDAHGSTATASFPSPGAREIGLAVTARNGQTDTRRRTLVIDTDYALPRPPQARLMSPFPVVRLAGQLTAGGADVRLFAVRGPVCSKAEVTCSGDGCPARRQKKFVGRGRLRFPRFERRLPAGTVLAIRITKADLIGKITRFTVREGGAPRRVDRCLRPNQRKPSRCPED
jgi:hypothetical protein